MTKFKLKATIEDVPVDSGFSDLNIYLSDRGEVHMEGEFFASRALSRAKAREIATILAAFNTLAEVTQGEM